MAELPSLVLIGDSIRLGYEASVRERLAGRAVTTGPATNCGNSASVLRHLDRWAIAQQPAVVHLNCGLHDLRLAGTYDVDVARYEANLREIVQRLELETSATLIFATTTPVDDERHAGRDVGFDRLDADVRTYNEAAVRVMQDAGVSVNDLHAAVVAGGPERLLLDDGTHFTHVGYELLAAAVAGAVEPHLAGPS